TLFSEPKGEGRVLSAANEQRIRQARDILNEVLDQLAKDEGQNKAANTPLPQQQELLSLYQAKVKNNKNKIGR
ncbi:MAG: hypothetical protein ACPLRH_00085, partial [Desulfotomaculales bacterium]